MAYSVFVGAGQWQAAAGAGATMGFFGYDREDGEWRPLSNGLPASVEVRCIVMHPGQTQTIYAGTQAGPYRSDDGGESWRALALPDGTTEEDSVVWSICLDPTDPETVYVGTQNTSLFRSRDGGASFQRLNIPEPDGVVRANFAMRVIRIAVAAHDANDILVAFEIGGLVASRDGGESWQSCNKDLLELSQQDHLRSAIVSDQKTEGMMDSHALAMSPNHPGTVWLANRMGLFRSDDGGGHWSEFGIGRFSPLTYARDVKVSGHQPERIYAALSLAATSDAGSLYRSDDFGQTWNRFDHGVEIDSTLMAVAEGATSPDRVYCAARHGKVYGTEDGGKTWQSHQLPGSVQGVYAIACT
ncbi:MAG: hypothetical protein VCD66_10320 [Alphaproteobacteria bacterium]